MKKTAENRMSMFYAVEGVCDKHTLVWTPLVPYATAVGELKDKILLLEDAVQLQESELKGYAEDKRHKKEAMVDKTLEVAQATYALAVDKGDDVLKAQMDHSRSDLLLGRDTVVGQRCQDVHDLANAVVVQLAPYGILPADMTALQTAINAYVTVVDAPRVAVTVRKGATTAIDKLVTEATAILTERMDKLMVEFKSSAPDFWQQYFDARIIVDLGGKEEDEEPPPPTP
ncbi:MAG: hypothetical protein IPJ76_10845 [Flavobacteriales bacterium]|nr:MAG: hypothetical protein IPJ76_10845 [Flavobacteriales bacterium]